MKPTRKTIRLIALAVTLTTSTSFANAEMLKVGSVKKYVAGAVVGAGTALYMQSTRHIARDLSYHPDKAEPFFEEHPDRFGPVFRYVQRTLSEPISQKDYDRYFKLSELMSKLNIPGFQQTPEPGPTVYDNPIHTPRKDDHRITTPITPTPAGVNNIIYTPQGNPIDIKDLIEEFPGQIISSWSDYLLLKNTHNVRQLEKNMRPLYGNKPFWYAPHHLVAWDDPRAKESRDVFNLVGLDINDGYNGVYIPQREQNRLGNDTATRHPLIHTDLYYNTINQRLRGLVHKQDVITELNRIRDLIKLNQFPY